MEVLSKSVTKSLNSLGIKNVKAPNTKRHVKTIVENKVPTDSKANWRPQCMMWFLLDKRVKQVDFICYDERYTDKKCHIISIFREDVEDEIIEMTRMGKLVSKHMVDSIQTSAHVQSFIEADVTKVWNWRLKVTKSCKPSRNLR
mgnify:CR=1 FL=1